MKTTGDSYQLLVALLVIALAIFANERLARVPPEFVASNVPDTVFSGERARQLLLELIPENKPHPGGSLENKKVRDRILAWLQRHDISAEVDARWGCYPERGRCAWAENIVARIPGQANTPTIALMAHYDSVNASPGAGDDMLGVSIIMEVARMITSQGKPRSPLLLIITDAEEDARLGAEAFYTQNPLVDEIGLVLNLAGTGSGGDSLLFRAVHGNQDIVHSYARQAPHPRGASFGEELIKLLPSDTDLTVVERFGITGAEFGFNGFGNYTYHTPLDNTQNLDIHTIQNHGENLYALVSKLSNVDVNDLSQTDVAYDVFYGTFVVWPLWLNGVLVIASAFWLLWLTLPVVNKRQFLGHVFLPILVLVTTVLIMVPTVLALHTLRGVTPLRPAFVLPYTILTFGFPVLAIALHALWVNKRWQLQNLLVGISWFWLVVSLVLTLIGPKAAYVFLFPTFFCVMLPYDNVSIVHGFFLPPK